MTIDRKGFLKIFLVIFFYLPVSAYGAQGKSFSMPGPLEIVRCNWSSPDGVVWALGMDFDPTRKKQKSNYSIVKLDNDGTQTKYTLPIPVGTIVTPYRAKNQVLFFRLIHQHLLYVAIKQLDGKIFFVKFDTRHPEKKQETMTMRLKGEAQCANVFASADGSLRFVGSDHHIPYIVAMDTEKKKLFEHKGFGLASPGTLKASALLSNNNVLLAFNTYTNGDEGSALMVMINSQGKVQDKKKIEGIITTILPADNSTAMILIAHGQTGKDMEAQVIDSRLNVLSRFPVPNYFKLMDAAGQLLADRTNSLISIQVDRKPGSTFLGGITRYSRAGSTTIGTINNPKPGKLRAYNISAQQDGNTLHVGIAVIGISKENLGQKTYSIHSLPVH